MIVILKKDLRQNKYEEITYIAKNANIETLCQNKEISLKIDIEEITKVDNAINII